MLVFEATLWLYSHRKNTPGPNSLRTKRYLIPGLSRPALPARSQNAPPYPTGLKESEAAGQRFSPCRRPTDIPDPEAPGTGLAHCITPPEALRVFELLLVQGVSSLKMLSEKTGGPLAKLHSFLRIDPVTYRNDGIEVVMFHLAANLPASLSLFERLIRFLNPK